MSTSAKILEVFRQSVLDVIPTIPVEKIIPENSLKDLGANSLDRTEIIMLTLRAFKLRIPLVSFAKAKNIGDLLRYLEHELSVATS
jgi:polyketide biosynthesis acyl carrier protein